MGGLTSLVKGDRKLRLAKAPQAMRLATAALTSKPRNCDGMTGKREVDRFVRPINALVLSFPANFRVVASLDRKCLGQKAFRDQGRRSEAFSIRRQGGSRWRLRQTRTYGD